MENNNSIPNSSDTPQNVNEEMKKDVEGESISKYVNQDVLKQLLEMGFSKNASEKALFFNKNILEPSVEWIYEHQNDADFEEEMRIVGRSVEEYNLC
ncbi:MAG: hypothetical protein ACKO96_03605 [Flammeovirgaceae bacterium]